MSSTTTVDDGLARLLAEQARDGTSGIFTASSGKLKRLFCLRDGRIAYAASNLIEEQFDEILVRDKLLQPGQRMEAKAQRLAEDRLLDLLMVGNGANEPAPRPTYFAVGPDGSAASHSSVEDREALRKQLRRGELDDREVVLEAKQGMLDAKAKECERLAQQIEKLSKSAPPEEDLSVIEDILSKYFKTKVTIS